MQKIGSIALAIVVIVSLCLSSGPAAVQAAAPDVKKGAGSEYLILLPAPDLHALTTSRPWDPSQLKTALARQAQKAAQPLLQQLHAYQQQGILGQVELRAEQNAIAVQVLQPSRAHEIAALAGVQEFAPAASLSTCLRQKVQALPALASALSARMAGSKSQLAPAQQTATDPSIAIYAPGDIPFGVITGNTTANIPVSISLQHLGKEFRHITVTSDADGYFEYSPFWMGCGEGWGLVPGDVVQVTAHGKTVSTTLVYVTGMADPDTNIVSGKTKSGQKIRIDLTPDPTGCDVTTLSREVTADSSGAYTWNFTPQKDFHGSSFVRISAVDANGNTTFAMYEAFHLQTSLTSRDVYAVMHPLAGFTATHQRGTDVMETLSDRTDETGAGYIEFSDDFEPGDVVAFQDGVTTLTATYTPFTAAIDAVNNRISGTNAAGHVVLADISAANLNPCAAFPSCGSVATNDLGAFSMDAAVDLLPGDYVEFEVFDANGNVQQTDGYYAPYIQIDLDARRAHGVWPVSNSDLTVQLLDNSSSVLESSSTSTYTDGSYSLSFSSTLAAGDKIEVTDGATTKTYDVLGITATLNNDTGQLSGADPANAAVAVEYQAYDRTHGWYNYTCHQLTAANGTFSLDLSSQGGIHGRDHAWLMVYGPGDGESVYSFDRNALTINAELNSNWASGYSVAPNTAVTARLLDGQGQELETQATDADSGGYYYVEFGQILNTGITPGMKVQVTTAGLTGNLTVPTLTVSANVQTNSLSGKSPAGQPVLPILVLRTPGGQDWVSSEAIAGADGNYSASFAALSGCTSFQVGAACSSARVSYTQPDGHTISLDGSQPPDVQPDAYEAGDGDNDLTTALPYAGLSSHTFDTESDVDWIRFTVGANQVGKPLELSTVNLGPAEDTLITLYDQNHTELGSDDDSGPGRASTLYWTPTEAGDYYVEVIPYSGFYNSIVCGSTYDFVIHTPVYLPLVAR